VAEVLAVESSKNKVDFLFLVRNVAEWRKVGTEVLHWHHGACREDPNRFIAGTIGDHWCVWFSSKHIVNLSVSEEK
jgi:hypothetical protein